MTQLRFRSKYIIPRNYCSWFNRALIFKERRMRRNKLPTVAGYSVVKLSSNFSASSTFLSSWNLTRPWFRIYAVRHRKLRHQVLISGKGKLFCLQHVSNPSSSKQFICITQQKFFRQRPLKTTKRKLNPSERIFQLLFWNVASLSCYRKPVWSRRGLGTFGLNGDIPQETRNSMPSHFRVFSKEASLSCYCLAKPIS